MGREDKQIRAQKERLEAIWHIIKEIEIAAYNSGFCDGHEKGLKEKVKRLEELYNEGYQRGYDKGAEDGYKEEVKN